MYALIGKQVKEGRVVKYRFYNFDKARCIDISSDELIQFMHENECSNVILENDCLAFKWQDLLSLPNFKEDGTVSTYNFKVLADMSSSGTWVMSNVFGSLIDFHVEDGFGMLQVAKVHSAIIRTKDRVVKFSMKMDGTYESTEINNTGEFQQNTFASLFSHRFNFTYCVYDGKICQYLDSRTILTNKSGRRVDWCLGSFGRNTLSYLYFTDKGYHIYTDNMRGLINKYHPNSNYVLSFNTGKIYVAFGLDGLSAASVNACDVNPALTNDLYERMLALNPDGAEKLKRDLHVGVENDVVYCNLAYCDIPDGAEEICDYSLACTFDTYKEFNEAIQNMNFRIEIPDSVKKFSSLAFINNPFLSQDDYFRVSSIYVRNPDIAQNVVTSLLNADVAVEKIVVDGDSEISRTNVKRLYDATVKFGYQSKNLYLCLYGNERLAQYKMDVSDFEVKPYGYKSGKSIQLETQEDFDKVYAGWNKDLKYCYTDWKKKCLGLDNTMLTQKERQAYYDALLKNTSRLYLNFKRYSEMLMSTAVRHGDSKKYKSMVDSAYKHTKNLEGFMKKDLVVAALKYGIKNSIRV